MSPRPSGSRLSSTDHGTSGPSSALAASTSRRCAASISSSMPSAIFSDRVWSVIARYPYPRSAAASAISRMDAAPSLQRVCIWRSPRAPRRPGTATRAARTSASVRKPSLEGSGPWAGGGSAIQAASVPASTGPMPASSVRDRPDAATALACSGHSSARLAARRSAWAMWPVASTDAAWSRSARRLLSGGPAGPAGGCSPASGFTAGSPRLTGMSRGYGRARQTDLDGPGAHGPPGGERRQTRWTTQSSQPGHLRARP